MIVPPSYDAVGLVNLMAEIEIRLSGRSQAGPLSPDLSAEIPEADTIVLVLFDGLGLSQTDHPRGTTFREAVRGTLEAGFPSTTSTSLATVATGLTPAEHGIVAHLMWMREHERIVNTLKWVDLSGTPVEHPYESVLPGPNLWERLREAGIEPITVQPGDFERSPLTRLLYRGARFEGVWEIEDIIDATVQLAGEPGRLIFTYVPHVDYAGHVFGLESVEFGEAIAVAGRIWEEIQRRLPATAVLIGTADHGLIDYPESNKMRVRGPQFDELRVGGDSRGVHVWSSEDTARAMAHATGGTLVDARPLLGPGLTDRSLERLPPHLLLAPDGTALLPRGFDKRLRAYHGGLAPGELLIPLLVGSS